MKKGFLKFVVIAMVLFFVGLKPMNAVSGVDTNVCVFTNYDYNHVWNSTNCIAVTVTYPKSWPTWYLITSTNLSLGSNGWNYADNSLVFGVTNSPAGVLPKWKTHFVKKDMVSSRFFGISTNAAYGP